MSRQSRLPSKRPREEVEEEEAAPVRQRRRPEADGLSAAMHLRQQAEAPPDASGDDPLVDPMQPCPRDDIDWSKWVQDPNDPITDPDFCLWSVMGRTSSEMQQSKNWQKLLEFHTDNYDDMPPFDYCRGMQNIYNTRIRNHLVNQTTGETGAGPAWPPQNIYNYTLKVRRTPNAFITTVMHTFFEMADVYQANQLFLRNAETGKRTIANKDAEMFMKMADKAHKWFELYRSIKPNRLHAPN